MQDSGDNQLVVGLDTLRRHAWREAFEQLGAADAAESDAVPRHDRGSDRGSGLTSDMTAVRIVATCPGLSVLRRGALELRRLKTMAGIMTRVLAPLRRCHLGRRHG